MDVDSEAPWVKDFQNAIVSKLQEIEVGAGNEDGMAEYISLLLQDNKSQQEVTAEVASDFFNVEPSDSRVQDFGAWLFFEWTSRLNAAQGIGQPADAQAQPAQEPTNQNGHGQQDQVPQEDQAMADDSGSQGQQIPTGPKAGWNPPSGPNPKRQLNQINNAMDRSGMHKIKGAAGVGRIGKDVPKGPAPKGPRANRQNEVRAQAAARHFGGNMTNNGNNPNMMNQMNPMGMNAEQQMQFMQMLMQSASSMFSPEQQQAMMNGQMGNNHMGQQGGYQRPLHDRITDPSGKHGKNKKNQQSNRHGSQDTAMQYERPTLDTPLTDTKAPVDTENTVCRYNLMCTKSDCSFAHQSPAAPSGIPLDMTNVCSFGVACKNRKCTGKHPSPAKKNDFKSAQPCRFFPNCQNAACPFQHPDTPPCRNGADCQTPDCKFYHSTVECKFDPCTNPNCMYKHKDGQKRGKFTDKVWIAPGQQNGEHISERKFTQEGGEEELIIPGQGQPQEENGMAGNGAVNNAGAAAADAAVVTAQPVDEIN